MKVTERVKTKSSKGFTLIELLCVILILGILMTTSIVAVSRMISKARGEQRHQNEKTISIAAESYLQANKNAVPRSIGGVTRLNVSELKAARYITSDIVDGSGQSCMKNSYVRVYKYSKTQYTFTPYVYCGNEKVPAEEKVPEPKAEIKFQDDGKDLNEALVNIRTATIRIDISGGVNTDGSELGIDGYNYVVSARVRNKDNTLQSNEFQEVYNSGTLSANGQSKIFVEKMISDYVDVSNITEVNVKLTVRNNAGGLKEIIVNSSSNTVSYNDKVAPVCGRVLNEAKNENDWITTRTEAQSRTISVDCMDDDEKQSGCVRGTYTKTWPNPTEREAELGYITIEDNAHNKTKCPVKVYVDITVPKITVTAHKRDANGKSTGGNILKSSEGDGWSGNTFVASEDGDNRYVIKDSDYSNITIVEDTGTKTGWFNNVSYPNGVVYKLQLEDNLRLDHYEWITNDPNTVGEDAIYDDSLTDEYARGTFGESNKKRAEVYVGFVRDGFRSGILKVYDKAGNITVIKIYANLDRTAPKTPQASRVSATKIGTNEKYVIGNWTNKPLEVSIDDQGAVDYYNDSETESKFNYFKYQITNKNNDKKTINSRIFTLDSRLGMAILGSNKLQAQACDKAGNCSDWSDAVELKFDDQNPTCTLGKYDGNTAITSNAWTNKSITVKATCNDAESGCDTTKNAALVRGTTYSSDMSITNAGPAGAGVRKEVYDLAGNKAECTPNQTIKIDKTPPSCKAVQRSNANWTNSSVKVSYKCADTKTNNVSSGCNTTTTTNPNGTSLNVGFEKTYNGVESLKTVTVKAFNISDNAGNVTSCPRKVLDVYYDKIPPVLNASYRKSTNVVSANAKDNDDVAAAQQSGINQDSYRYYYNIAGQSDSWVRRNTGPTRCGIKVVRIRVKVTDNAGNETIEPIETSYTTKPCCSEDNPWDCPTRIACREGISEVHETNGTAISGAVCREAKPASFWSPPTNSCSGPTTLYIVSGNPDNTGDDKVRVCYKAGDGGTWTGSGGGKVCGWMYSKCINNSKCAPATCPG